MILEKNPKKSEKSLILVTVSLTKEHWKKVTDITQKRDFCTWSIYSFVGKVKQYVRKYYITSLIDLANKLYDVENSSFHFIPCVIKNCLALLRNFVNKPVE